MSMSSSSSSWRRQTATTTLSITRTTTKSTPSLRRTVNENTPPRCIAYQKTMTKIVTLLVHPIFKPTKTVVKKNASVASKPMPKRDPFGDKRWSTSGMSSSLLSLFGIVQSRLSLLLLLLISMAMSMPTALALASPPLSSSTLGFLSFDLDDTLFPTHAVVEDSNHVMIQHMREVYQCSTTLNDFLATTRTIRSNKDDLSYTDLRKCAIRQEFLLRCSSTYHRCEMQLADQNRYWQSNIINENNADEAAALDSVVNDCFQIWINERHAAAQRYLFPDALEMLQTIKTTFPNACIAAITNGRGNPLEMQETLAPWFDFCISGEDAHVFPHCKPNQGIYEIALSEYQHRYPLHSLVKHPQKDNMNNNNVHVSSDPTLAQQQQHIWCHVGDCLGNDVGASASCGAYAVWLDLESNEHYMGRSPGRRQQHETAAVSSSSSSSNQLVEVQQQHQPSWSTASQSDLEQRAQRANQVKEKIIYSSITSLSELPNAIHKLLLQQSSVGAASTTTTGT